MGGLDARDILWVWEEGRQSRASRRALVILMAATPEVGWRELAQLPLGQRQARLLVAREETFGPRLEVFVECPGCGAELEFELDTREERRVELLEPVPSEPFELDVDEVRLELRLPNTDDVSAIEQMAAPDQARRELFSRCLISATRLGDPIEPESVPDAVVAQTAEQMAARDPQAESLHDLDCPTCGHHWQSSFDIAAFFWREIEVEARRLLREVDLLARSYGWSEEQILSLSAFRRRCYMELIGS